MPNWRPQRFSRDLTLSRSGGQPDRVHQAAPAICLGDGEVDIVARPEELDLCDAQLEGDRLAIAGHIIEIAYFGQSSYVSVRTTSGR